MTLYYFHFEAQREILLTASAIRQSKFMRNITSLIQIHGYNEIAIKDLVNDEMPEKGSAMGIISSNLPLREKGVTSTPLCTCVIASSDMWYGEINQREIVLVDDPAVGWVVRGEIPGCGPTCHADLCQVLLEACLGCERCSRKAPDERSVQCFGEQLGLRLGEQFALLFAGRSPVERLTAAIRCIFHSMSIPFEAQIGAQAIQYTLPECPILATAVESGYKVEVRLARLAFATLLQAVTDSLAPGWSLKLPTPKEVANPPFKIAISPQTG
jgi:hypothetical protein